MQTKISRDARRADRPHGVRHIETRRGPLVEGSLAARDCTGGGIVGLSCLRIEREMVRLRKQQERTDTTAPRRVLPRLHRRAAGLFGRHAERFDGPRAASHRRRPLDGYLARTGDVRHNAGYVVDEDLKNSPWATTSAPKCRCTCSTSARKTNPKRKHIARAGQVRRKPHAAGPRGQDRPGRGPRAGDRTRSPDSFAPQEKQPDPDRRGGRGQERHHRRTGAAHRARRGALHHRRQDALLARRLVARGGTKFRGEFEERMQQLLDELRKAKDTIIFIDEIHTIVGAGSTQGSLDTANILKPALARGELQAIGATTLDEYRENIETDSALERRFQKVVIEPTTPEQTLQILRNIAPLRAPPQGALHRGGLAGVRDPHGPLRHRPLFPRQGHRRAWTKLDRAYTCSRHANRPSCGP